MMASDASVALTLSFGSIPKFWMRSLSGATSLAASPITAAISATPCSRSAALPTPTPMAVASPPTAATVAVVRPATVACATPPREPRLLPMLPMTPDALSSALMTIVIVS